MKFDTAHVLYHSKHSSLNYLKIKPSRCYWGVDSTWWVQSGSWRLCSTTLTQILLVATKYQVKEYKQWRLQPQSPCQQALVCVYLHYTLHVFGHHCWLEDSKDSSESQHVLLILCIFNSFMLLISLTRSKIFYPDLKSKCRILRSAHKFSIPN